MSQSRLIRVAIALQLAGLLVELGVILETTPKTFVAMAGIGAPLILAGVALYLFEVLRGLIRP